MTKILVTFYYPSGKFRKACVIDVGEVSLNDEQRFKQRIVDHQDALGIGWQGYYYVHTDLVKPRTEWYRGFHSKIFKPKDFEGIGKVGNKPFKFIHNMKTQDCRVQIEMAKQDGKMELKMGEPRPDDRGNMVELKRKGYRGLYGRYP